MALFLNKVCLCYTEYKIKFCIVNWAAVSVGGGGGTVNILLFILVYKERVLRIV